jgi:hypothetical protein
MQHQTTNHNNTQTTTPQTTKTQHEWLAAEGAAPDAPFDSVVLARMKGFAQMNKLKRMAMMVVGQALAPDELAGTDGGGV